MFSVPPLKIYISLYTVKTLLYKFELSIFTKKFYTVRNKFDLASSIKTKNSNYISKLYSGRFNDILYLLLLTISESVCIFILVLLYPFSEFKIWSQKVPLQYEKFL